MKNTIIIIIGLILTIVFTILSISTGIWGCGGICYIFIGLFFVSIAIVAYGAVNVIKNWRESNG